jgi:hypothetical protein
MCSQMQHSSCLLGNGYLGEVLAYEVQCKLIPSGQDPAQPDNPPKNRSHGTIQITNYGITFYSLEDSDESFRKPIAMIASVNILNAGLCVSIEFKDFNFTVFEFACQEDRDLLFQNVYYISFCQSVEQTFPFQYKSDIQIMVSGNDGWIIYDQAAEYLRLGISCNPDWRTTDINKDFRICNSYQNILAIPSSVSDIDIEASSAFRSVSHTSFAVKILTMHVNARQCTPRQEQETISCHLLAPRQQSSHAPFVATARWHLGPHLRR